MFMLQVPRLSLLFEIATFGMSEGEGGGHFYGVFLIIGTNGDRTLCDVTFPETRLVYFRLHLTFQTPFFILVTAVNYLLFN